MKERGKRSGLSQKEVIDLAERYYATTTVHSDFVPSAGKRAKGPWIWGADGKRYLDFCSGVGVANCGYGNQVIEKAMVDHLRRTGRIQMIHHDFHNPESVDAAKAISEEVAKALGAFREYKVFFANSGTEANEAGLKLAFNRQTTRKKILAFHQGFHGRTLGSLSLMEKPVHIRAYPRAFEVHHLTFPAEENYEAILKFRAELAGLNSQAEDFASAVVELVQGEGGIHPVNCSAIQAFREFCALRGILFHVDEVQTGYGRTGKFLACEHYPGLDPDIVTLGKGIANGYPFSAMAFRRSFDWNEKGRHSSTYGGNALGAVTALATLRYLKNERLLERAAYSGLLAKEWLDDLTGEFSGLVMNQRGLGLMRAVDFYDNERNSPCPNFRDAVVAEAYKRKLLVIGAGAAAIRIMPPLGISESDLKRGFGRLREAISAAAANFS